MSNKYKLTTIKDIFDKVPTDRIDDCMSELTALIKESKAISDSINTVADIADGEAVSVFPESVTWVDDKKKNIDINVKIDVVGAS